MITRLAARAAGLEGLRYLAVGAGVVLVNNALLIAGDGAGLGYGPLMALSWAVGGTLGYVLHSRITFRQERSWAAYGRFMGGVGLGVPLAWAALAGLKSGLGWPMRYAAPGATVLMFLYNYLSARLAIVWRAWFGRA